MPNQRCDEVNDKEVNDEIELRSAGLEAGLASDGPSSSYLAFFRLYSGLCTRRYSSQSLSCTNAIATFQDLPVFISENLRITIKYTTVETLRTK